MPENPVLSNKSNVSGSVRTMIASFISLAVLVLRWAVLLLPMGFMVGSIIALFLWLLEAATDQRFMHPALLYGLPAGGVAVALCYRWWGGRSEGGNNLVIDEIHKPGGGVPWRMAPLVLFGTVISHLFGASVGREGTAVQIGGSIASGLGKFFRLETRSTRIFLMAGVAAGFGAVFGTPVAGAIFGLEVLAIGRLDYAALLPTAIASLVADWACRLWGIRHTEYHVASYGAAYGVEGWVLLKVGFAAVLFGLASRAFAEGVHRLAPVMQKICPHAWLRPALGGVLTILLVWLLGTRDYLGLGVVSPVEHGASIVNFFLYPGYSWSWLLKLVFTIIALSTGFKGGEVTPLFFVGAALGNALASILHLPVDLLTGIGFVAVFAGAANTPLTCTFMAVELFGGGNLLYYALGCFVAYFASGHTGIYLAQHIGVPKFWPRNAPRTLRDDFFSNIALRQVRIRHLEDMLEEVLIKETVLPKERKG